MGFKNPRKTPCRRLGVDRDLGDISPHLYCVVLLWCEATVTGTARSAHFHPPGCTHLTVAEHFL